MKLIVEKSYYALSKTAANIVRTEITKKPNIILGLPTGSTPIGVYNELISMHKGEGLDFSQVSTFNLDEYLGIDEEHPNSYHYFMNDKFFNHININKKKACIPNGKTRDLDNYCKEYEGLIEEKGGIDLQILGIGENGHIGFNEPDDELNLWTTIVDLTESTIEVNSRFFDNIEQVPKKAITMGIGSIMKSKKIILLASGKKKRKVITQLLKDKKITTKLPVSMLLLHPDVTVIVDEEAYNS